MQQFCAAAVATNGNLAEMIRRLGITPAVFIHRLSLLRTRGLARTVTVHDPLALGAVQSTVWVRMVSLTSAVTARFERDLLADRTVASAQRVTGGFDYRLSVFHADRGEQAAWVRSLRCRADVAKVEPVGVVPIFGHALDGLILRGRPSLAPLDPSQD
jgi:hypothetical protein